MGSLNKVFLMGNLTKDVETKQVGESVAGRFGMAVNRRYKGRDGWTEETTFVDCDVWGKQAELMAEHCTKGSCVLIEGRLKLHQWKGQDGAERSRVGVVVENFQFAGGERKAKEEKKEEDDWGNPDDVPF